MTFSARTPEQVDSFDGRGHDGHRGRDTSRLAAAIIRASAEGLRHRVLGAIRDLGEHGAICDEIECALDITHQTASARVHELAWAGFIQDSGRQRKTRSGRAAVVWVAVREAHVLVCALAHDSRSREVAVYRLMGMVHRAARRARRERHRRRDFGSAPAGCHHARP